MTNHYSGIAGGLFSLSACAYREGLNDLADQLIQMAGLLPVADQSTASSDLKLVADNSSVVRNAEACANVVLTAKRGADTALKYVEQNDVGRPDVEHPEQEHQAVAAF